MNSLKIVKRIKRRNQSLEQFIKIEASGNVIGHLRPVRVGREDAQKMAKWRTECFDSFFTWIQPAGNAMLQWLKDYEKDDKDIIFVLETPAQIPIGQMAIYNIDPNKKEAEFGRVVHGEKDGLKGIMVFAATALLRWAFTDLKVETVFLKVFDDNGPAIALYKSLGFHVSDILLFKKTETTEGIVQWVPVKEKEESLREKYPYRKVLKLVLERCDLNHN